MKDRFDYIVIGSGAGGATIARELTCKGKDVAVIEAGFPPNRLGTFRDGFDIYDLRGFLKTCRTSKEGIILWRAMIGGGTTVVSCGNGIRCLEQELWQKGIQLQEELDETEQELGVAPIPERFISHWTLNMAKTANSIGITMVKMPKMINEEKCVRCGKCVFGCAYGAKWNAYQYLVEAVNNGADVFWECIADKVVVENGKECGVVCRRKRETFTIFGQKIIVAAGGLGSPVLLKKSGIENAGNNLFMDLFVNVYGIVDTMVASEPPMSLVCDAFLKEKGFILSPFVNKHRLVRFKEMGMPGLLMQGKGLVGIMVKTRDDNQGTVYKNGLFSKIITPEDQKRLHDGVEMAKGILQRCGVIPTSIKISKIQGSHPGGTCAIGSVVNTSLETCIHNLFVCDASILPISPGLPPIVTIIALGKWLAKRI
ncbi:MAG: GMC family oxidoreductase N-terminal domain-containing protein [bacterium]